MTITGNTRVGISGGDGGGLVTVVNSTIADNVNPGAPAEVAFGIAGGCASFTLRHVTVAGNDRGVHFGSCSDDSYTVENTLVVENTSGDCSFDGVPVLAGNTSLDSDGTCRTMSAGAGSIFSTVTNLAFFFPLADNGGPTMTVAVPPNSPAVDQGSSCTEARDQRGASRDALCDIGAFERSAAVIMNSATGGGTVTFQTSAGAFVSFHPVAEANMPNQAGKPAGVTFPYGFFEWSIQLPAASGTADVAMTFPAAVPTPAQYWKVIDGIWRNVCLLLACTVDGNTLTIAFGDGGIADLDGITNAVIVDPGGLGSSDDGIDVTPPQFECDGPDGAWYAADVTIACSASDEGSGLADPADAAFSLATHVDPDVETSDARTDSRQVCDAAGNCATAGPIGGNRVDKKVPIAVISSPSPLATYQFGEVIAAGYSCADNGSGLSTCAGPVSDGAAIDTHSVGTRTFTVHATDVVGHESSATVTYQVECHYVSVGVSPSTVVAGNVVSIVTSLRSCSTSAQTVALRFTFTGLPRSRCHHAGTTIFTTPRFTLAPGSNRSLSFGFRVPRMTCAGDYSVSVATLVDGSLVETTSATLTVVR